MATSQLGKVLVATTDTMMGMVSMAPSKGGRLCTTMSEQILEAGEYLIKWLTLS